MNNLGVIAFATGLQDGLNPCIFMTCAVFISQGLWLKKTSLHLGRVRLIFVMVYTLSFLALNFGPAQTFILRKEFILAAKILYFVLGLWTLILGILFFQDWFLLRRGLSTDEKIKSVPRPWAVCLITVVGAVVLGALATVWPINKYMVLLGNMALLKNQWLAVAPLLTGYTLASMWPLWLVWAFLSIKNVRVSLLKIFCATIFWAASSSMILIFIK